MLPYGNSKQFNRVLSGMDAGLVGPDGRNGQTLGGQSSAIHFGLLPLTQPKEHGSCCHMYQERVRIGGSFTQMICW